MAEDYQGLKFMNLFTHSFWHANTQTSLSKHSTWNYILSSLEYHLLNSFLLLILHEVYFSPFSRPPPRNCACEACAPRRQRIPHGSRGFHGTVSENAGFVCCARHQRKYWANKIAFIIASAECWNSSSWGTFGPLKKLQQKSTTGQPKIQAIF